jgi:uncharacterized coiled-coil protein SlyX
MDEFLIRHKFHTLDKTIEANKAAADQHLAQHDSDIASLDQRVDTLEGKETESSGAINTLRQQVTDLQKMLADVTHELNKTKLINLKQDIVIRTLHNMQAFDAYDMFADTFADATHIDMENSIRAEWMPDYQAVGKTRRSVVELQQLSAPTNFLIAKNQTSDEAIAQSFVIDKTKQVDKVSIVVSRFNDNTTQPLIVSIRATIDGPDLTSRDITANEAIGGFVDVELPDYMLDAGHVYYLVLRTNDSYGYRIGMDTVDKYLGGTSFSLFNNVWTDNNHDIAFKIWCFPSEDENNATILSVPKTLATTPKTIVFEREETLEPGSGINYFVSRDGGLNWKILQPGIVTNLDDLPPGNKLVLKAYILGSSRIEAWGYVVTRSDV